MIVKPVLQALLVADHVYVDAATGKKVVAGIFHNIQIRPKQSDESGTQEPSESPGNEKKKIRIPAAGYQSGSPFCYMSITNVRSPQELDLRFIDLSNEQVLIRAEVKVNADSPLKIVECVVPLPSLPIPHPGTYAFEVLCDDEPLGSYRINAIAVQSEKGESDGN